MPTGLGAGFAPLANSTGAGRLAPGLSRGLGVEGAPLTGLSFAEHSFELIGNAQGPGPAAHVGLVQLALHEKDVFDVEEIPWPSRQQFEENQILGGDQVHGLSLDLEDVLFMQGQLDETYMRRWAGPLGVADQLERMLGKQ